MEESRPGLPLCDETNREEIRSPGGVWYRLSRGLFSVEKQKNRILTKTSLARMAAKRPLVEIYLSRIFLRLEERVF